MSRTIYFSATTGGFYFSTIHKTIPKDAKPITETRYDQLLNRGKELGANNNGLPIFKDNPARSLDELKHARIAELWSAFKTYQRERVDPEDLTLATRCSIGGSKKGKAVEEWVLRLWAVYYQTKSAIVAAPNPETLAIIKINPSICGEPPYTIIELNQEVARVYGAM